MKFKGGFANNFKWRFLNEIQSWVLIRSYPSPISIYVVRDARRGVSNFEEMTWCRVTQQKYVGNSRQILGCAGLP